MLDLDVGKTVSGAIWTVVGNQKRGLNEGGNEDLSCNLDEKWLEQEGGGTGKGNLGHVLETCKAIVSYNRFGEKEDFNSVQDCFYFAHKTSGKQMICHL